MFHQPEISKIEPGIYSINLSQCGADFNKFSLKKVFAYNYTLKLSIKLVSIHDDLNKLLRQAIIRRVLNSLPSHCILCKQHDANNLNSHNCSHAKIALLFSGGIDCTILAFLLHKFLPIKEPIDLLNVVFYDDDDDNINNLVKSIKGNSCKIKKSTDINHFPDRKNAIKVYSTLVEKCDRTWNLIQVNVAKTEYLAKLNEINRLIFPGTKYPILDNSIGPAFYFASRGCGYLYDNKNELTVSNDAKLLVSSTAQVLFSGFGADELFAGYVKHRVIFKNGGNEAVEEEILRSVKNMWERNLGRDDRIISSHGKEVRYPYLDEDLVDFALSLPANLKADPKPPGFGDKMLLREMAANLLGIPEEYCHLPKKAIQFGSNIAKLQKQS